MTSQRRSELSIHLSVRTVSLSNMREHWAKRHRRESAHRLMARAAVRAAHPPEIAPRAHLTIRLTRLGRRKLDDDNLRGALKSIRDGVADALGMDDGHTALRWSYSQERSSEYGVRIEIAATPEPETPKSSKKATTQNGKINRRNDADGSAGGLVHPSSDPK